MKYLNFHFEVIENKMKYQRIKIPEDSLFNVRYNEIKKYGQILLSLH